MSILIPSNCKEWKIEFEKAGIDIVKTEEDFKNVIYNVNSKYSAAKVSIGIFVWLALKIPCENKYTLMVFLLKEVPWALDEKIEETESLRGRSWLKWSQNRIHVDDTLPCVRMIDLKGKIILIDDIRLALLMLEYVEQLPLSFYAPVKYYTYKYLPKTFNLLFGEKKYIPSKIREEKEMLCEQCKTYSRSVQVRKVFSNRSMSILQLCNECSKPLNQTIFEESDEIPKYYTD